MLEPTCNEASAHNLDSTTMTAVRFGGDAIRHRSLLILLVLIWAISWPVIKVGVTTVPAIWFGCLRYIIAAFCLFAVVALRRELAFPSRSDWPLIAVSGALQMAAYSALTGLALTILPPGRASVLAFSTPIWVVPLAAWWLHERISRLAMFGVAVGLSGVSRDCGPLPPCGRERPDCRLRHAHGGGRGLGNLDRFCPLAPLRCDSPCARSLADAGRGSSPSAIGVGC